jgi:hypothetical protein
MTTIPNIDDVCVLHEWDLGMPYLPGLTEVWMQECPHPNYVDGWYLWCDVDTKATYVVQTANPDCQGLAIHMGGDMVVNVPYGDTVTEYYGQYEEYDPDYTYGNVPQEDYEEDMGPAVGMCNYKVGYMWDNTGKGYTIGNKHHTYGWWCLDDILWDNMLWDMAGDYILKNPQEEALKAAKALATWANTLGCAPDEVTQEKITEYLGTLCLQMGGENVGADAHHLEHCLTA